MSRSYVANEAIAEDLAEPEYNRRRVEPHPADPLYIHLSDIRLFLDQYINEPFGVLLDYGCGGSPYRKLFKAQKYLRADYVDGGNLDCLIPADGRLSLSDNSCDAVLSTQVLEHVFSPQIYLKEALRVLRPGGKLILTTHGIWEDHGCPYDFRRWTFDGLNRELEQAGFQVKRAARLTTGSRAIVFQFAQILGQIHDSRFSLSGIAIRLLRRSGFALNETRHRWMDRQFPQNRAVYGPTTEHGLYLALGVEGIKPVA